MDIAFFADKEMTNEVGARYFMCCPQIYCTGFYFTITLLQGVVEIEIIFCVILVLIELVDSF